ncbi:MAG: hypothetical protein BWY15_02082 [Firmicutes bacterium ADurb.Bin193]|nr:MAG: hypothetical protein BWY15_02082 [Firmicutes bacterium ADurb.Bin193]
MAKIIKVVYDVDSTELTAAKKEVQSLEKETKKSETAFKKMGDTGGGALNSIRSIAATIGLAVIAKQIFDVTAEFQKLAAVLTNTLGSRSLAQAALNDIKTFASQTPFSVQELTASFVKLANQGFKPTLVELRKLGDIASSQGKSFDQLTEALIDAQTGEFERLKEFGIRAAKEGNNVLFTFKGVKTQVDFTNESIRNYVLSLGEAEGVSGSMAAISQTLGGQVSNLGDSFDSLFNGLGQVSTGILAYVMEQLNQAVQWIAQIIDDANKLEDPFSDRRAANIKKEFDAFQQLTKPEQAQAVNRMAQEVQEWRNRLDQLTRAFAVNQEEGLTANQKLEKASKILGLSVEDTLELFKNQNIELKITKSNVLETEELFKLFNKQYTEGTKAIDKNTNAIDKNNKKRKETPRVIDVKPDDTASKIEKAFDQAWDATTGKQKKSLDILNAGLDKHVKKFEDAEKAKTEAAKKAADEREEYEKRKQEAIVNTAIDAAQQILYASFLTREEDFSSREAYYQKEIELAGDNENARKNIEQRREIEEKQFRDRQLAAEKSNSIKKILIDTAANVVRSIYNNGGIPLGLPFGYLAAALGAVQVATVRKYKDGEVNIDGPGTSTSDSISARLSKGESVINAKATAASRNLLEAINDRKIDDRILQVAASNGGRQVSVFDDSKIIRELRENRVQFENHGYTLMKHAKTASNFKSIMRSKIQGY